MPQVEQVKEKGYDILYLTDYIDEFTINMLNNYDNKKFVNVCDENLDLETEKEKETTKKLNEENKEMLDYLKEKLNISEVRFTGKLKSHPVCLKTKGEISTKMEQVLKAMPNSENVKAETILEINENHKIKNKLQELYKNDKKELLNYAKVLYDMAKLIDGLEIENPTEISNLICDIMIK